MFRQSESDKSKKILTVKGSKAQKEEEKKAKERMKKAAEDPHAQMVVKAIAGSRENTEIDGNTITYHDYNDMAVAVAVKKPQEVNELFVAEMIFAISHDYFDEPIMEFVTGLGDSPEGALLSGARMFMDGMLDAIICGLDADNSCQIRTQIMGEIHTFRKVENNSTLCTGASEPNMHDMFELIEQDIPHYLGTKKAYWLELEAIVSGGRYSCSAKLNNIVYPELTQVIYKYAKSWKNKDKFHSEKQVFLFIQEENTYIPSDITKDRVVKLALQSIELFKQVHDDETRSRAINTVKMLAKDDVLAFEMCTFLPEIYTQKVLGLKESDGLVILKGDKQIPVGKAQIRTYGYIEDLVEKYLRKNRPSKEDNMKIMALSTKMQLVTNELNNGATIENLIIPPMSFAVKDDYTIR